MGITLTGKFNLGGRLAMSIDEPAPTPVEPYFTSTSLLLKADGQNGDTNSVILDSSPIGRAVSIINGSAGQGSFTPFTRPEGEWSVNFNGTSSYLKFPVSTTIGAGDYTIEFWIKAPLQNDKFLLDMRGFNNMHITTGGYASTVGILRVYAGGNTTHSSAVITTGEWVHCAIVRTGGSVLKLYVNGTLSATGSDTSVYGTVNTEIWVGQNSLGSNYLAGSISNLRISRNAVYTSNFTRPSAPLSSTAQTVLLGCNSNGFMDVANNTFATVVGGPAVKTDNPFLITTQYNPATMGGGCSMSSAGFLSVPNHADFQFGTQEYTVDFWVYPYALTNAQLVGLWSGQSPAGQSWTVYLGADGTVTHVVDPNDFTVNTSTIKLVPNAWYHIAATRTGDTFRLFINGKMQGTGTTSPGFNMSAGWRPLEIGTLGDFPHHLNGVISNVRIIKGQSLYSADFAVPTAPTTSTANTKLLLNFTNGKVLDSVMTSNVALQGGMSVTTASAKPGQSSSLYFDGVNDFVTTPNGSQFDFSAGAPFTIEMWINYTGGANRGLIGSRQNGQVQGWGLYIDGNGKFKFAGLLPGYSWINMDIHPATIATGTWTHIALVKDSTGYTGYVNGVAGTKFAVANGLQYLVHEQVILGAVGSGGEAPYKGYIDDVRITNGIARYNGNFTPTDF